MIRREYDIPDNAELDLFLARPLHVRGQALLAMTPTRRIAYSVAVARRSGKPPYRVLDEFTAWQALASTPQAKQ